MANRGSGSTRRILYSCVVSLCVYVVICICNYVVYRKGGSRRRRQPHMRWMDDRLRVTGILPSDVVASASLGTDSWRTRITVVASSPDGI